MYYTYFGYRILTSVSVCVSVKQELNFSYLWLDGRVIYSHSLSSCSYPLLFILSLSLPFTISLSLSLSLSLSSTHHISPSPLSLQLCPLNTISPPTYPTTPPTAPISLNPTQNPYNLPATYTGIQVFYPASFKDNEAVTLGLPTFTAAYRSPLRKAETLSFSSSC